MKTLLIAVVFCTLSSTGFAQRDTTSQRANDSLKVYTIPSVTVTTTRADRARSPVPYYELGRAEIAEAYTLQDFPALLARTPSMLVYSESGNSIGYSNLSLRGFDQRRISVTINGIPQNDPEDHNVYWIDFPDIASSVDNVQVQRGAGLMNYGPAAIGGSINLQTSNFANQRYIKLASGIGMQQYDAGGSTEFQQTMQRFSMEISSGIVENTYAFYGRLSRINSDGYRDLSFAELNSFFLSGVRFDDNLTTQINIFGGPLRDGLAYGGLPKSYVEDPELRRHNYSGWQLDSTGAVEATLRRRGEEENFSQPHYELLNDWYINDNLTLKSSLFYYTGDGFFDFDGSWADSLTLRIVPEFGFPADVVPSNSIIRANVSNEHGGWLPRLLIDHGDGLLTLGTEIRLHRSDHFGKIEFAEGLPTGYDPDYKIYSYNGERDIASLYGREQFRVSDNVTLNAEAQAVYHAYRITNERAGGRFTQYRTANGEIRGNGEDLFSVEYFFINPRLGATFRIDPRLSAYGSVAYTSREPRMANLYNASESYLGAQPLFAATLDENDNKLYDFGDPLVEPEKLLDIEVGGAYRANRYTFGLGLYWMEFFDELVSSGQLDIFGAPIDGNAPRTRHVGAELEASALVFQTTSAGALNISANATISQNTIIEYDFVNPDRSVTPLEDNPIAGFPEFIGNLQVRYQKGPFTISLHGRHVGEFYTDNFKNEEHKNDAYTVFNSDIAYTIRQVAGLHTLRLRAQVQNILNEFYSASGIGANFFPAAERSVYLGVELEI